jgi:hypothetical protein
MKAETYIALLQTISILTSRSHSKNEYKTSRVANWEAKYQTVKPRAAVIYSITIRLVKAFDAKDSKTRRATIESLGPDLDKGLFGSHKSVYRIFIRSVGDVRTSILLTQIIPELVDTIDDIPYSEAALQALSFFMQYGIFIYSGSLPFIG